MTSVEHLHALLLQIVAILEKYYRPISPNIIYLNGKLYGVEINKQNKNIESLYPLNSEAQEMFGISQKDYDSIVNQPHIPTS